MESIFTLWKIPCPYSALRAIHHIWMTNSVNKWHTSATASASTYCHSSWVPGPILILPVPSSSSVLCVCVCEQVSVGVCDWGWFAPAESHYRGLYQILSRCLPCQILAVFAVFGSAISVRSCSWFRDSRALLLSWTPNAGDSSAHCFPALPASAYGELHRSFAILFISVINLLFSVTESSRLHCDTYMALFHCMVRYGSARLGTVRYGSVRVGLHFHRSLVPL